MKVKYKRNVYTFSGRPYELKNMIEVLEENDEKIDWDYPNMNRIIREIRGSKNKRRGKRRK